MKKCIYVAFVILLCLITISAILLVFKTSKQNEALQKENNQLQFKISALNPEVGQENNGVVYASSNWEVYDSLENANMSKDPIGNLSDNTIIQELILNNSITSIDLRNTSRIGIRFTSKNTFETYDGVHKQLVYSITSELFLVPAE